jgi:hypothetical protein
METGFPDRSRANANKPLSTAGEKLRAINRFPQFS